jgi:GNAT superfamily N-acetyltransferase
MCNKSGYQPTEPLNTPPPIAVKTPMPPVKPTRVEGKCPSFPPLQPARGPVSHSLVSYWIEVDGRKIEPIMVIQESLEGGQLHAVGSCTLDLTDKTAYIRDLFVHAGVRRNGIASMICRHSISQSQRLRKFAVALHVKKTNTSAIKLYRKLGFFIAGDDGDKIYFMSYPLPIPGDETI